MPYSKAKAVFLVRHGETRLAGTYCGSMDPPLNRRGRTQAASAARLLKRHPIDICYCSPLQRARQTAHILLRRRRIPLKIEASLQELHFGRWEGLTFQEVERKWPRLAQRWADDPMSVRIPDGERLSSLRRRIKRFLWKIRKQFSKRTILVVAHGGSLSAIALELLKLPDRAFFSPIQPPGSIRKVHGRNLKALC